MTVQEYFRSLDREKFINAYIDYCSYPRSSARKKSLRNLLSDLDKLEVTPNSSTIIFSVPNPGSHLLDSYCIHKEDLNKEKVEHYAYEMFPMETILGYQVSQACIYLFPYDYQFACSILYELTFFGYDLKVQNKEVTQFTKELEEQLESIKSGEFNSVPAEEVFERLGWKDTRTEFEKEFDYAKNKSELDFNNSIKKSLYELEKRYLKISES